MSDGLHILGIRHHDPGSARSVVATLEAIRPQVLLVEGLPDADDALALAAHAEMRPPVALQVYRPDEPKRAVFYPFAAFFPEWQAIRWAPANQVPVRFMDLQPVSTTKSRHLHLTRRAVFRLHARPLPRPHGHAIQRRDIGQSAATQGIKVKSARLRRKR